MNFRAATRTAREPGVIALSRQAPVAGRTLGDLESLAKRQSLNPLDCGRLPQKLRIEVVVSKHKACYMIVSSMPHPLASHLAPIIDLDVDALRSIVAEWVVNESSEEERARYRRFGAELRALKARVEARPEPPTEEEIEIALTALLAIAGRSRSAVAETAKG